MPIAFSKFLLFIFILKKIVFFIVFYIDHQRWVLRGSSEYGRGEGHMLRWWTYEDRRLQEACHKV